MNRAASGRNARAPNSFVSPTLDSVWHRKLPAAWASWLSAHDERKQDHSCPANRRRCTLGRLRGVARAFIPHMECARSRAAWELRNSLFVRTPAIFGCYNPSRAEAHQYRTSRLRTQRQLFDYSEIDSDLQGVEANPQGPAPIRSDLRAPSSRRDERGIRS